MADEHRFKVVHYALIATILSSLALGFGCYALYMDRLDLKAAIAHLQEDHQRDRKVIMALSDELEALKPSINNGVKERIGR